MRCFFLKGDQVVSFEHWPGLSAEEALAKARGLLSAAPRGSRDGFELWVESRLIARFPSS
jgi:hypothetical protein